jgi:hypothetical protein
MTPLDVVCWRWGDTFGPEYPNRLRAALARHLHLPHRFIVVGEDHRGLHQETFFVPMPTTFADTPRCRRRMQQFSREFAAEIGAERILAIDLDVVIVDDLTPIVDRPEPIVGWKVAHAGVYSGSFLLFDAGALHGAWEAFAADPEGYPKRIQSKGVPSDQAMVNAWLQTQPPIPFWTEQDGFVTYYGEGYERLEHLGVGPRRQMLPNGARIVVLGSADKHVMDTAAFSWIQEHWTSIEVAA